jgi:iron complex transport system substrate-binding protein
MKKVIALLLALVCLAAVLGGCQPAATTTTATTAAAATTAKPASFPITIKDANGKDVVIASQPTAIVVTNLWAAEILLDLVDTSRVKGLSAWGDNAVLSAAADKAKAVAGRISTKEPEKIVALKPDLVVIDTFSDPDGSLTKSLTQAGSVVLQMSSPTNFEQIKAAIATLAAATGETAKGTTMIQGIDAKLKAVSDKLAGLAEAQKLKVIYYEDYYDQSGSNAGMLAAYGQESPFTAIAKAAGLVNVCSAPNYSAISKEKVVGEWKPDLLVVPAITYAADYSVVDDKGATIIKAIKADKLLTTLPAVQNDKVIALTEKYRGSTSQYMVDAVAELAKAAYPERFK